MRPADGAPGEVLGHETRFAQLYEAFQAPQMFAVERIGRAQRQPDAVQTERVQRPQPHEIVELRAAVSKVVFAVRLEPADRRTLAQQIVVVLRTQPDAGARRNRGRAEAVDSGLLRNRPRGPRHVVGRGRHERV